jgi:glycosyltransferase involved in cell wall biosynthesis
MIHFVTPYSRQGPSSRVRVYEWLERIAVPHTVIGYASLPNSSPTTLLRHPGRVVQAELRLRRITAERPDSVFVHREASPLSRGSLERRLLTRAGFSVYDFDDALQWDVGEGPVFRRLAPKARKALVAAQTADRVIAGNAVLAEWAASHNRDVVIVPSCVSPAAYRPKDDYELPEHPRLVWIGSVDNEAYLEAIAPALREVNGRTGARLTLISSTAPHLGELEQIIDRLAWSEELQHARLSEFDVGIAPVPDEPYERGKCGYKLLQYAAAGLPFVASPVGVNAQMLAHFGMPAPLDRDDWSDALVDLLMRSASERGELGRRARMLVERDYSYDAWLSAWKEAAGLTTSPQQRAAVLT